MPKRKYFCFSCRTTKRRIYIACKEEAEYDDPSKICPECRCIMLEGNNFPTPKKSNTKAWTELRKHINMAFHHRAVDNKYSGNKTNIE